MPDTPVVTMAPEFMTNYGSFILTECEVTGGVATVLNVGTDIFSIIPLTPGYNQHFEIEFTGHEGKIIINTYTSYGGTILCVDANGDGITGTGRTWGGNPGTRDIHMYLYCDSERKHISTTAQGINYPTTEVVGRVFNWSTGLDPEGYYKMFGKPIIEDPYKPGGTSTKGGGKGKFDRTGDAIAIPSLPQVSAVDTGFITIYNPSLSELHSLAQYMWSGAFDMDAYRKIFADPMQCILGMSIVPVAVPNGSSTVVRVGNISTGVSMTRAASQYVEVDCGSLTVNEFWGAYLDYDPYTKAEIYLPYVGTHPISVDDIMGQTVQVVYHVDILSGACCAYVKCGNSVLYSFVGQCSCSVPISGQDWTNVLNGALSIASSIGTMVATGGASAPMSIANMAMAAVNSFKPNIEKSGALGGMGGMMGIQTPYLILSRPRQARPDDQNIFTGYPSFITSDLSDLVGYTEVEHIHLHDIPATQTELDEIENLLKRGVLL